MSKHTPGPWKLDGSTVLGPETSGRYENEPIATVNIDSNLWVADSCLIAAAPDMLKALKAARELLIGSSVEVLDFNKDKFDLIRNAITKAEGKE